MSGADIKKLKAKLKELKKQINEIGNVMRGSVVELVAKNKQPYFSLNKNKKTQKIYLVDKKRPVAMEYSNNYIKILEIIEEMTEINMILIKENACDQSKSRQKNL